MGSLFVKLLINTVAISLVSWFYSGIYVNNIVSAVLVALILGILNTLIRPILMLFALPINIITLGLFTFVINGFMLWVASWVAPGFYIRSFIDSIIGAILISLVSMILGVFSPDDD
ncbi:MAG: hypothetical protein B6244_06605 [Candidatus Cloacimonetes bacterium 4572_55]|nr:MAG: hypothetical protein B6244_06605 [Candidatus Cloacimonetes bacterium 4572_55]